MEIYPKTVHLESNNLTIRKDSLQSTAFSLQPFPDQ